MLHIIERIPEFLMHLVEGAAALLIIFGTAALVLLVIHVMALFIVAGAISFLAGAVLAPVYVVFLIRRRRAQQSPPDNLGMSGYRRASPVLNATADPARSSHERPPIRPGSGRRVSAPFLRSVGGRGSCPMAAMLPSPSQLRANAVCVAVPGARARPRTARSRKRCHTVTIALLSFCHLHKIDCDDGNADNCCVHE